MTRHGLRGQAIRYVLVGGTNTVLTYALFIGLGLVIPPGIAFTVAYMIGLLWVVFGSSKLVFQSDNSPKRLVTFALWYLLIYAVGQFLVQLIAPKGVEALLLTSLVVVVITTPLTFFGGRFIFGNRTSSATESTKD